MSLRLPLSTSHIRDLFDVAHLAELGTAEGQAKLPSFRQVISGARAFFAAEPKAKAIHSLTLRADGELWLVRVGPRGGWKRVWNFSK